MKNYRGFIINCISWEGKTMRGGWIASAVTADEAEDRIQQWSKEITNGEYVNWPADLRPEWIATQKAKGNKIAFTINYVREQDLEDK